MEKAALQIREELAKLRTGAPGISVGPHPEAETDADDLELMLRDAFMRAAQVITGQVHPNTLQKFLRIFGASESEQDRTLTQARNWIADSE